MHHHRHVMYMSVLHSKGANTEREATKSCFFRDLTLRVVLAMARSLAQIRIEFSIAVSSGPLILVQISLRELYSDGTYESHQRGFHILREERVLVRIGYM